jgi:DNA transformation protein
MTEHPVPVEQLRNIGATIARRLREIGIHTRDELQAVGAAAAYRRICEAYPGKTIPVCYYLYSLEGALRDEHWDALGSQVKQQLLAEVSAMQGRRASPQEGADEKGG